VLREVRTNCRGSPQSYATFRSSGSSDRLATSRSFASRSCALKAACRALTFIQTLALGRDKPRIICLCIHHRCTMASPYHPVAPGRKKRVELFWNILVACAEAIVPD